MCTNVNITPLRKIVFVSLSLVCYNIPCSNILQKVQNSWLLAAVNLVRFAKCFQSARIEHERLGFAYTFFFLLRRNSPVTKRTHDVTIAQHVSTACQWWLCGALVGHDEVSWKPVSKNDDASSQSSKLLGDRRLLRSKSAQPRGPPKSAQISQSSESPG